MRDSQNLVLPLKQQLDFNLKTYILSLIAQLFNIFRIFDKNFRMSSKKVKIGVLKETKTPPDRRTAVPPETGAELLKKFPEIELVVQKSPVRCFPDAEYSKRGIPVVDTVSDCDILVGVKEVHIPELIPEKTYLFFSHTAKKQPYNRELLRSVLKKKITLIDYEYLTDINHNRLVAFGRWAGIVGAYNGLRAWGARMGTFSLKPAHECHDMEEMFRQLEPVKLPPVKILITGGGRVAHGALETLVPLHIRQVSAEEFLTVRFDEPVVCRIDPDQYVQRKDGGAFNLQHFFQHPADYVSTFRPFTKVTDLLMACHYWDPASPVFMTPDDYRAPDFKIKVIADVSCDIKGPIPSTLRASTIEEPFYGYDSETGTEGAAFDPGNVTVMAVDNLPGELPRNASCDFGRRLLEEVFPALLGTDDQGIIKRATLTQHGVLTSHFAYLKDYVEGKE